MPSNKGGMYQLHLKSTAICENTRNHTSHQESTSFTWIAWSSQILAPPCSTVLQRHTSFKHTERLVITCKAGLDTTTRRRKHTHVPCAAVGPIPKVL